MKKKITLLFIFVAALLNAQQKSTGVINLTTNMTANMTLDNGTSLVTLTLSGPNDRWFALQFGSFSGGMEAGADLVYWNGSILVDARHNGIGNPPTNDTTNNWTLVTNTDNSPSAGLRTLVYTRPFSTGDSNDFTFNFANSDIDLAWARFSSASFALSYHGATNRGVLLDTTFAILGLDDFSLNASRVYPNPSTGNFTIATKTFLNTIDVYTINGVFVKTIKVDDTSENVEFNLSGLPIGVYLLELKNDKEKIWKKVIIE
ncbi:T9SS type A sorting domain-containing protein [Flavobacterium terrigena]|uniref:Por secretion system C-terminal sorting domain-containing protein n=1 Tax=Flavobacterium terrigena TaxID=402734 RepID=A0A1H6QRY6_9FLAO|nr:T9SS type A sorting domain-containing protein [Flavobacterium terrigena]SEI46558.1 Por secretion system C-terminal sorting domain-containing protein [Flavobacterium terrigena]